MEDEPAKKWGSVELEPQEPPANVDFISSLPDEMLVTIISHLPIKYGVRTIVLSRWCRLLWCCTPQDLIVDHVFCSVEQQRLDALSHILDTYPGLVRRHAIGRLNPHNKTDHRLHYWFLSPALDRLEELSLHARRLCSLPPSVFRLAPTLRSATFRRLHITSMNVRAIYVHKWRRPRLSVEVFQEIVIENAPFLERLYVHDKLGPARMRVIHAPKLTVLGYSCAEFNELVTGSLSVQILAGPKVENVGEYTNPIECLDLHLTEITFNEYRGTTPEIKFARFFVEKASLLKVMRLFRSHYIEPLYDFSVADPFAEIMHEKDSQEDEFYVFE
ncbi:uncharacterized protein [Aegilops tauschii subsp. strangulata]|uniref:uncharacterized protein n=1 Tax=Aegilops tauschii subsp. strangulata TaxID=200361 RepID=UPI003CC88C8F